MKDANDQATWRDLMFDELVEALQELHAWSRPFIEKSPISAETQWRRFPKAVEQARAILAKVKEEGHG